ncbi:MAG: type I DNA topoisomerase [Acidobacteriota bacterium]|nr:type I DNA topoisomerase [Acidobacteriota bacterium]
MTSLVIVESPAKAKTISRILGKDYSVEASYGHVRDLPESADQIPEKVKKESWARLGVNVGEDFAPLYVVPQDKKKYITRLRQALKGADELLLATDEDREGESISWHVVEVLKPKVPVRRIAFHEITDDAIKAALAKPREIDENLVRAQESRRIVDRLYGYQLSPVLWKKVRTGLSAGRVQSVAVRLCVLRERERQSFRSATYWDVEAEFVKDAVHYTARLSKVDGQKVASGQDFDPDTGELKKGARGLWIRTEEEAQALIDGWETPFTVTSVEKKPQKRRPAPPFTTSSLQQEANRKLRFSARHTMRVAQRLYEGIDTGGDRVGLITYMRTDSTTLSEKALKDAVGVIKDRYGDQYTDGPRRYATKAKGAQEAHEAIRPTELSRSPEQVSRYLNRDEQRLYELIWKRTLASQMADARLLRTSVEITAAGADGDGLFTATGMAVQFPGFLRAYVEGSDDPAAEIADREVVLPELDRGDRCNPRSVEPKGHETQPPARYTEASLVKKLEAEGIGRPSTYATIMDTIQNRGYVVKKSNALVPTFTAFAVTKLLESHFADYVDTDFTARMEQQLDDIAGGSLDWKAHLQQFYFGDGPEQPGLEGQIAREQPEIDYPAVEIGSHPGTGNAVVVKVGRFGPYLQTESKDGERVSASLPDDLAPADLTIEKAVEMLEQSKKGAQSLGEDPDTGKPVYLASGRFGPYVQLGETPERGSKQPKPKRASLPKGVSPEEVTLKAALKWLSLPRTLGEDPDGVEVVAASGRYGPFIKRGDDTRSLTENDDVYAVTLERALELLAQPKTRGRRATRTVLQDFGKDDAGNTIQLLDGRYGPYITNGELNASLSKGADPQALTREEAERILAERGKAPKRRRGGAKKAAGKKGGTKKKAAKKKTTSRKTAAKKSK